MPLSSTSMKRMMLMAMNSLMWMNMKRIQKMNSTTA